MFQKPSYSPRGEPAAEEDVQWLTSIVDELGDVEAARIVNLSRPTINRILARRPLLPGTRAQLREARRTYRPAA